MGLSLSVVLGPDHRGLSPSPHHHHRQEEGPHGREEMAGDARRDRKKISRSTHSSRKNAALHTDKPKPVIVASALSARVSQVRKR